ncbi:HNH endonuclease domain-containing protein [Isoalcanivorax pacificus W11-5]|uniref:HNH endonuclease domain-containing protein n=2 Tax=Isoalcanivorax TaxID=3020833 RepID=A0A0B4XL34_9GAMM|nr:HNH endonuclease domain-containing protein [Isoalcanivorax pacificus W11-5]
MEWLHWQDAACLYARGLVTWTLGDVIYRVRGGISRCTGERSEMQLHSIIACDGRINPHPRTRPPLTNRALFRRDQNICLYCGQPFSDQSLTRDHIVPTSRGGRDTWLNVVAACRRCNQHKGSRLLEECNMELLALPYVPNMAEYLALINSHRIRGDQMEFLRSQFSRQSRWLEGMPAA